MAAGGGPAYCPLVYGYVTYQRPLGGEPGSSRLAAFDAPAGPGGIGSVLGGTGLAITRSALELGAAAALIRTLLSDEVQVSLYAELGGQSSARQAWQHPGADAAAGGFYRATLATSSRPGSGRGSRGTRSSRPRRRACCARDCWPGSRTPGWSGGSTSCTRRRGPKPRPARKGGRCD